MQLATGNRPALQRKKKLNKKLSSCSGFLGWPKESVVSSQHPWAALESTKLQTIRGTLNSSLHAVPKPSIVSLTPLLLVPYSPLLASDTTEETQGKVPPKGTKRKLLGARYSIAGIMSYTCNTFTCHKQLAEFPVAGACPSFTAFLAFIWLCFGNIPVSCRGFTLETRKDTIPIILGLFP